MTQDAQSNSALALEIAALQRQVRWLQGGILALVASGLLAASTTDQGVIRAKGLVIVDAEGRERIVMGAPAPRVVGRREDVTESLIFRSETGAERVIVGEQPGPRAGGRVYPRMSTGWGMTIYNLDSEERGGMVYLDAGRSVVALDRPTGDAVGMLVDEKSGFAGLVMNYDSGHIGQYTEAIRLGATGSRAFVQATNRDGTPAGALITGSARRPEIIDSVKP